MNRDDGHKAASVAAPSRARDYLWLALLTGIGAALRLVSLNTRSLWLDEVVSVDQAAQPLKEVILTMAQGVHPPLFHILLHYWITWFGAGEISIRSYAAVWGILAIPAAYWAGTVFLSRRGALYSAAIVAFSPYLVWYSQEARMYSMMFLFGILSTGFLGQAIKTNRAWSWAGYSFTTFLGLFTHYFFPFLVIGQVCYYLYGELYVGLSQAKAEGTRAFSWRHPLGAFKDVPTLKGWLWSMLFIGTTYLLWLLRSVFTPAEDGSLVMVASATGSGLGYGQAAPSLAFRFNDSVLVLTQLLGGFHPGPWTYAVVAMWPLLVYLTMALLDYARPGKKLVSILAWSVLGIGLIVAAGQWQGQVLAPRYFAAVAAPLVLLVAHVLELLSPRSRKVVGTLLVVASLGLWVNQSYNPDNLIRFDNRAAFQRIVADYQEGDVVIYEPFYNDVMVDYYLPDTIPSFGFPEYGQFAQLRNGKQELGEDLYRVVGPSDRAWLMLSFQDIEQLRGDAYNTKNWFLRNGFKMVQSHQYNKIELYLFERVDDGGGYDILTGR